MNFNIQPSFRTSSAVERMTVNLVRGTASVTYKQGFTYNYTNVSRRAILNLLANPNMSLGFWVNNNLLFCDSKCAKFGTCELAWSIVLYSLFKLTMFHVYYLTNDGEYMLTSRHHDEDDACDAVYALSERMPHALCDYVYKDVG